MVIWEAGGRARDVQGGRGGALVPFEVVLLLPPGLELDSSTLDFLGIQGVSSPRSPPPL